MKFKSFKEYLTELLSKHGETWADVVSHNISDQDLASNCAQYCSFPDFELWTVNNVYSKTTDSDDGDYFISLPRNPPNLKV